jgi:hypothetical protein
MRELQWGGAPFDKLSCDELLLEVKQESEQKVPLMRKAKRLKKPIEQNEKEE